MGGFLTPRSSVVPLLSCTSLPLGSPTGTHEYKASTLILSEAENLIKSNGVVYMSLCGEKDNLGFPPHDSIPPQILTEFPHTERGYWTICYVFVIHHPCWYPRGRGYATARNTKAGIMHWVRQMCDTSNPPDLLPGLISLQNPLKNTRR